MIEAAPHNSGASPETTLPEMLKPERIMCGVRLSSKKKLLQTLADLLSAEQRGLDPNAVLNSLLVRERLSNTGLGNGVALPHGRLAGLNQPLAAFIHMSKGVDYDASDGKPVDLVFAMVVPENAKERFLECLPCLGELLRDVKFSAQLRNQVRAEHIYTVLTEAVRTSVGA